MCVCLVRMQDANAMGCVCFDVPAKCHLMCDVCVFDVNSCALSVCSVTVMPEYVTM